MPPVKKLLAAERARRRTGVQHAHGREEESNECDGTFFLLDDSSSTRGPNTPWNSFSGRTSYPPRPVKVAVPPAFKALLPANRWDRDGRLRTSLGTCHAGLKQPGHSPRKRSRPTHEPPSLSAWKYYLAEPLPLCHRSWRTSPAAIVSEPQPPSPSAAQSGAAQPGPSSSSPRSSPGDTASQPRDCHLQPLVLIHIGYEKLSPSRRPPAALATASDHPAPAPAATPPAGPAVVASGPSAGRDITHALTSPATATHIHAFYDNTASGSSPPSSASPHGTAPFSTPLAFPAPSSSALPTPPPQASAPPSSTYTPPSSARRPSHAHSWSPTWPSDFPPFCTDSPSSVPCQCPCHLYAVNLFLEVVLFVSERVRGEGVVGAETTREGQSNENAHGSANEGRRRLPEADLNTLLQELGVGCMSQLHHIFDGNGWTLIHSAARQGNTPVLEALVGVGMSIGELGKDTLTTPMHLAALGGHVESMQLLRSHGADIRARTRKCWTLLHHAAKEQQWDAVRRLAQQGIKPEEVERPGANPKADKLPANLMAQAVQIVQEVYELEVLLTECIVENGNSMGGHATAAGS